MGSRHLGFKTYRKLKNKPKYWDYIHLQLKT